MVRHDQLAVVVRAAGAMPRRHEAVKLARRLVRVTIKQVGPAGALGQLASFKSVSLRHLTQSHICPEPIGPLETSTVVGAQTGTRHPQP